MSSQPDSQHSAESWHSTESSGPSDSPRTEPGQRIGRYEIVRPLGTGGFAHTFVARDTGNDRVVAIKTLHGRSANDLKAFELFEREATVLLGLRHHGIPEFVEFFRVRLENEPTAVLVMEHIEGASLARMIAERKVLAPVQVLDLLIELLGILDYLHTRLPPILHRDIKPSNVIVRHDGGPVLVDFGAVRNVFRGSGESGSTVVGTYGYMPYEQYMGQASAASDLYALGATLLHLVTGRAPTDFMTEDGRLAVPETIPIDEPLRGVLTRLLDASPQRRYPTARAAREALLDSSTTNLPATRGGVAIQAASPPRLQLEATPRSLGPNTPSGELFRRVSYGPWRLMNSSVPTEGPPDVLTILLTVFFSVLTAGILPLTFIWTARARRGRLRPFFRDGLSAIGIVTDFKEDKIGFDEKLIRVRYDFEADGRVHRGSDQVHPTIAERLRAGDQIEILYLPSKNYDSVIIGGH